MTAEARTMVTAAVLRHCLCCRHLVVVIACHCPLPCNCPLCVIALTLAALAIACILSDHPCHHCHCPLCCCCHCSPAILVTVVIALPPSPTSSLPTLITVAIPLIVACHSHATTIALVVGCLPPLLPLPFLLPPLPSPLSLLTTRVTVCNHPLCCLCLHSPTTLVAVMPRWVGEGEDHTNPVHDPTLAATAGAAIIVAAFAAPATGREGLVQQCAGFQCPADGLRQRSGAAVCICVAGVILHADQQLWRQWQWHANGGGSGSVGNVAIK
jgi:hypothetical protein